MQNNLSGVLLNDQMNNDHTKIGFKETEIGLIPEDWEINQIGKFFDFTKKGKSQESLTIPFIPMDYIPIGKLFVKQFDLREKVKISSGTYVENGDLLLSKITPSFENGKQAILDIPFERAYATTEVIPIKGKDNISEIKYLYYYLLKSDIRSKLAGKMEGSTGRQRLSKSTLSETNIPLPKIEEQRKIIFILSTIQKAIDKQEEIIKTTTELKKSMMKKLFTEGLRGEALKETELGFTPKSWEVIELGCICEIKSTSISFNEINNINTKKSNDVKVLAIKVSDMNLIGNENILSYANIEFTIEKNNKLFKYLIPPESLVFPKRGAAISTNKKRILSEFAILDPNLIALVSNISRISPKFLFFYFQTIDLKKLTDNSTIPQLNKKDLEPFKIKLPEIVEQIDIVKMLNGIDKKINLSAQKQINLKELFNTMLHKLMTGQIRVNNINFENFSLEKIQEEKSEFAYV